MNLHNEHGTPEYVYDTPVPTLRDLVNEAVSDGRLGTFDWAIPLDWSNDVQDITGEYPYDIVWSYPHTSVWGEPFALTEHARALLVAYWYLLVVIAREDGYTDYHAPHPHPRNKNRT